MNLSLDALAQASSARLESERTSSSSSSTPSSSSLPPSSLPSSSSLSPAAPAGFTPSAAGLKPSPASASNARVVSSPLSQQQQQTHPNVQQPPAPAVVRSSNFINQKSDWARLLTVSFTRAFNMLLLNVLYRWRSASRFVKR